MSKLNQPGYRGRIAPSPTGYLHLGHAKTFWSTFQRCRKAGGTLIYRNEDIDFQRCRDEFSQAAMEDLSQLGIHWEEGPFHQSQRIPLFVAALEKLVALDLVYPCQASRKLIREHPDTTQSPSGEAIFPKMLRTDTEDHRVPLDLNINWRFKVPDQVTMSFNDENLGPQTFESQVDFGDFLIWRKEGMPSYELAVVVDDIEMEITEVVRGADLLVSTARQLLIYQALGSEAPSFFHEKLVLDDSGERLAKQKDSLALRKLFQEGHDLDSLQELWKARS